jgi:FtsP/CotA-like multicopper oxidase with cupredoxin domain
MHDAAPPAPEETGWKDTAKAFPGQVLRLVVRWAPTTTPLRAATPGRNRYPFDPTAGPGYVWHCHILDHEDNDMMRPMKMQPPTPATARVERQPVDKAHAHR